MSVVVEMGGGLNSTSLISHFNFAISMEMLGERVIVIVQGAF